MGCFGTLRLDRCFIEISYRIMGCGSVFLVVVITVVAMMIVALIVDVLLVADNIDLEQRIRGLHLHLVDVETRFLDWCCGMLQDLEENDGKRHEPLVEIRYVSASIYDLQMISFSLADWDLLLRHLRYLWFGEMIGSLRTHNCSGLGRMEKYHFFKRIHAQSCGQVQFCKNIIS